VPCTCGEAEQRIVVDEPGWSGTMWCHDTEYVMFKGAGGCGHAPGWLHEVGGCVKIDLLHLTPQYQVAQLARFKSLRKPVRFSTLTRPIISPIKLSSPQ